MRWIVLLAVIAAACSETGEPLTTAALAVTTDTGRVELSVQVADTPEERRTGLMGRADLAPYDGMAFVWDEPTTAWFWMKGTLIPLSIAFWDEGGRIVAMLDMEPCTASPCSRYRAGASFVGAVEVEQGLFEERGIAVGDRVELVPEV
jgi:hypothetical protein